MKSILVIGMGRFGLQFAQRMQELGNDVMVVDKDADLIDEIAYEFTDAHIADCTIESVLTSLGINNFDVCFVTIGEDFQAWANGPVCRQLFSRHRGYFSVSIWAGDASKVDEFHDAIITLVVNKYGSLSAAQLSDLTHSEDPWKQAREGLPRGAYSEAVITPESMRDYYRRIGGTKELVGDLLDA